MSKVVYERTPLRYQIEAFEEGDVIRTATWTRTGDAFADLEAAKEFVGENYEMFTVRIVDIAD